MTTNMNTGLHDPKGFELMLFIEGTVQKNVNSFYAYETREKKRQRKKDLFLKGLAHLIFSLYTFTSAVFAVECKAQQ